MTKPTARKWKWGEYDPATQKRQYPVHKYQAAVLGSTSRITFAFAGTGGGKTCIAPLWLVRQFDKHEGKSPTKPRYLVVSPTYKIFKQSRMLDALHETLDGTKYQGKHNKTENIYYLGTGGEVFFRSADTPDALEGGQYKALVIDEAAKISYDAWVKASARVGAEQGPILGITTPDINNWIHNEVFQLADGELKDFKDGSIRKSRDGTIAVVQWHSTVNPTYSKDELERQRRILPDAVFRRRYLGEFAKLEGLVYGTFSEAVINTEDQKPPKQLPSPVIRVAISIDWGWNDPLAILVGCECQDGRIYIVEEMYGSQIGIETIRTEVQRLKKYWANDSDVVEGGYFAGIYCDHSRPELIEWLCKGGIRAQKKSVPLIETGISMVDQRLRAGFLKVYDSCIHLIDEAKFYQRKSDRDGDMGEKPIDKNNHAVDSLRYLISGLDFGRRLDFCAAKAAETTPADIEGERLEKMRRLGLLTSGDPNELKEKEIQKQKEEEHRRFLQMAWGDIGD